MSRRPEHSAPPEIFYDDTEADKYSNNSRNLDIQVRMSERAYELLLLPENEECLLLDIGCGSGISGSVLKNKGHQWIGLDISAAMLKIAVKNKVDGDFVQNDMGLGIPFKAATFDGAISISALQWLCNIDNNIYAIKQRLDTFFSSLFASLSTNARAIFQFYPENDEQVYLITTAASKAGFFGGTIIDFPNSKKAKKIFLVLMTSGTITLPQDLKKCEVSRNKCIFKRKSFQNTKKIPIKSAKNWIFKKKEKRRSQGKSVKSNSKYSGRKRSNKF